MSPENQPDRWVVALKEGLGRVVYRWPSEPAEASALKQELEDLLQEPPQAAGESFVQWALEMAQALAAGDAHLCAVAAAKGLRLCAQAIVREESGPGGDTRSADRPTALATLEESPAVLKGCGPKLAERLALRGLSTVADLALFVPVGYEDRRALTGLSDLEEGMTATVEGRVDRTVWAGPPGRRHLEVHLEPEDDVRLVLVWFRANRGFASKFESGLRVCASGKVYRYRKRLQMNHPDVRPPEEAERVIVPVYPRVEGVAARRLRALCFKASKRASEGLDDGVPAELLQPFNLPTLRDALRFLHDVPADLDPDETTALLEGRHPTQQRFIFGELFLMQLELALKRAEWSGLQAEGCPPRSTGDLEKVFGFTLTRAQHRVIEEIGSDLAQTRPMQRLLQGDVGSGKTAVAFSAAHQVLCSGMQVAMMAPTEILALQHFRTLKAWAEKTGHRVSLLTGQTPASARRSLMALLESGEPLLTVGTHALFSDPVPFPRLGLAVVDEQHRFGVAQRRRLRDKGTGPDSAPHLLVMTATPIPRSLTLTLFGDLDLSVIDEMPPGRTPSKTRLFLHKERAPAWQTLTELLSAGLKAYVVCPLVSESDKVGRADAERTARNLKKQLPQFGVGLVHGRMSAHDKENAVSRFQDGRDQVLVATTVIEVGLDVPSAGVMVVVDADRFGLSQLHQLRGRVGRSAGLTGHCLLLAGRDVSTDALERLKVLTRTGDGFEVAEADLRKRGPGDLTGLKQAGAPNLRYAHLGRHARLLSAARQAAFQLASVDPDLDLPVHAVLKRVLEARREGSFGAEAG
jgi:ATP-dependent DNA helicase RecG